MSFLPFTRPTIDEATIQSVAEVLRSGWITTGPKCRELEDALSAYCGGRTVRVFNSGTATLEVSLRLAGVGKGDEVITTPLSWVATANVILEVGARPVFVDIDPLTRNIDLELIPAAITPRTKAIMPVDLAGLPVVRERLYALAKQYGLRVIEDAAQSFGANWQGQAIGSFGDFVSFSFHANKNFTTGEGGALVLPDPALAPLAEQLRLQGVVRHPDGEMSVDVLGGKSNLTDIAAAIGLGQLPHLANFTARRRELARLYFQHWDNDTGCVLPLGDFAQSNWHMFQILLPLSRMRISRGEFIAQMKARDIGVGVHYPAMHLFGLYRALGYAEGNFPNAESVGAAILTLPLFPAMTEADVLKVCKAVSAILKEHA